MFSASYRLLFTTILFGFVTAALSHSAVAVETPAAADAKKSEDKKEEKKDDKKKPAKKAEKSADKSKDKLPLEVKALLSEDLASGSGKVAQKGKTIRVNYTGWFYDPKQPQGRGMQLDTSVGKEPFSFTLGAHQVIAGWDDGITNMKVGAKRRLIIPSDLAYGSRGSRDRVIPPNQPLIFEVELLDVIEAPAEIQ